MKNGPISVELANRMISEHITYMKTRGIDMSKQTQSVSFTSKELMNWLRDVMPAADELRVFLGAYGKEDSNAGRVTVILWPYKNGQPTTQPVVSEGKDAPPPPPPTPPYNQGGLNP